MSLIRSIFKNTTSQVVSRIISSGSSFLATILIARYIGLLGYSDIAKVIALVSLFYLCVDLGANAIYLEFERKNQNFQNLLSFRLSIALITFIFVGFITFFLPYNSLTTAGYSIAVKEGVILFAFSLFSRAVVFSTAALFQQELSYEKTTIASLGGSLAMLLLVGVFVVFHLPVLWIISAYVIGGFVEAALSLILARQAISFARPQLLFVKKIFFSSLPLTLLLFINLIYFRADMILLSLFQKSTAVGIYDFAYKFFDFFIALPLFLSNSLYPHLLSQEKNFRIQTKNISLYVLFFFMGGIIFVPIIWYVSPLLVLVKKDFIASVLPLRILILSLPVFFATNILQWIFIAKKKRKFLVVLYGVSLVVNIVLNLLFIPVFSYNASAVITGISETLIFISMIVYVFLQKL